MQGPIKGSKNTKTNNMWKIDVYKRDSDGNKGDFLTSHKYPDEHKARKAYKVLRRMAGSLYLAPYIKNRNQLIWGLRKSHANIIVGQPIQIN